MKNNLDEKICIICNRPFSWRKIFLSMGEKNWENIKYSLYKRCRLNKSSILKSIISDKFYVKK